MNRKAKIKDIFIKANLCYFVLNLRNSMNPMLNMVKKNIFEVKQHALIKLGTRAKFTFSLISIPSWTLPLFLHESNLLPPLKDASLYHKISVCFETPCRRNNRETDCLPDFISKKCSFNKRLIMLLAFFKRVIIIEFKAGQF